MLLNGPKPSWPCFEKLSTSSPGTICIPKNPFSGSLALNIEVTVSSPGESYTQALSEPDVTLSAHLTPIIRPGKNPHLPVDKQI
ncbi:hypothetical protein ULO1_20280 [Carboxydocella sp. ULO1]|nr:hypothetical protein ULO1_20280 [Carboxydocella sp. ULO1]